MKGIQLKMRLLIVKFRDVFESGHKDETSQPPKEQTFKVGDPVASKHKKDGGRCELPVCYYDRKHLPNNPHHFEYTGEVRGVKNGEWYRNINGTCICRALTDYDIREILRLVVDSTFKVGDVVVLKSTGRCGTIRNIEKNIKGDIYFVLILSEVLSINEAPTNLRLATPEEVKQHENDTWVKELPDGVLVRAYQSHGSDMPIWLFFNNDDDITFMSIRHDVGAALCSAAGIKIKIPELGEKPQYPMKGKK